MATLTLQQIAAAAVAGGLQAADVDAALAALIQPTLRDDFAMAALQGQLAAQNETTGFYAASTYPDLAADCFAIADAMLAAR